MFAGRCSAGFLTKKEEPRGVPRLGLSNAVRNATLGSFSKASPICLFFSPLPKKDKTMLSLHCSENNEVSKLKNARRCLSTANLVNGASQIKTSIVCCVFELRKKN